MIKNFVYKILFLLIIHYIYSCLGHAYESPFCSAELDSINTRNHFVADEIDDPTGGFTLTIQPRTKNVKKFSPDFTITLDSTKYKTMKGFILYVEHENQTHYVDEDDLNLRIGHFIEINDQYFRPKRCGVKSPINSTLEHFNREDKPLPQTFTWTLSNVFDFEDDFNGVVKGLAVVSMQEWGVPVPVKFKPKNLIMDLYPEEYYKHISGNMSRIDRMKMILIQNPSASIIISLTGGVAFYFICRLFIRQIKLYMKDKKYEEYHKLENNKTQNLSKAV
ncbi:hypothetical protein PIROE2DRAFT_11100 [Piromyces sp. E2]|nr:hypothetical protein PIROE2DRAFT_11100 [Piromyces sp. E2]|eukprot:OUM62571.1 hypothetical protein PIROE2DRAFT_11100 [Piromyces sp. E2]